MNAGEPDLGNPERDLDREAILQLSSSTQQGARDREGGEEVVDPDPLSPDPAKGGVAPPAAAAAAPGLS
jgi:hypothetical protein